MTENVFDPSRHKIVAVDAEGQHLHVSLAEIKSDLASIQAANPQDGRATSINDNAGANLAVAVALASHAVMCGVQAGDYRWHGGAADFTWGGERMDAPGLIEYARTLL